MIHKPVFSSIQALRGIAALLVVVFHLRIVESKNGQGDNFLPEWVKFADGGVDLFFVISGFVMAVIARGRYRSPGEASRFLWKRALRILPPYWLYTTLVVALMLAAPGIVNTSYQDQSVLASYLLWPQATLPVLTVGWTLIHEVYFYLVMALAITLLSERWLPVYFLLWAGAVAIGHYWLAPTSPEGQIVSSPMTWEFIAGALIGIYWRHVPCVLGLPMLLMGVMGFAVGMWSLDYIGLSNSGAYRVPVFGIASALIVSGAVICEFSHRIRFPNWCLLVGDSSYSLYLSHVFVMSAMGRVWGKTGFTSALWEHGVFVVCTIAACAIVGWLSFKWVEKPLLAINYRMRVVHAAS